MELLIILAVLGLCALGGLAVLLVIVKLSQGSGRATAVAPNGSSDRHPRAPSRIPIPATSRPVTSAAEHGARWLPADQAISVGGYDIPGGMLYVGTALAAISRERNHEPALINPTLPVDRARPDHLGEGMPYWPSYSSIPPQCRAAYLAWLAGGRCAPDAYIGYVFLFFYGIERRLLNPEEAELARAEAPGLIGEVRRLLALYGANNSFRRYATAFLDHVQAFGDASRAWSPAEVVGDRRWPTSLNLRLGLGQLASEGRRLDVDWAHAWVRSDPQISLRTSARRCEAEFDALFRIRYSERYGAGLSLRNCKARVGIEYRPASSSFGGNSTLVSNLPDVMSLVSPRRELAVLVDECCDALDPLSRFRGPDGKRGDDLDAVALLPDELLIASAPPVFVQLRDRLRASLGCHERIVLPAEDVLGAWLDAEGAPLTKRQAVQAAAILQRAGLAVEPDVRFGGARVARGDRVVLFRAGPEAEETLGRAYADACLALHLAAILSWADGVISDQEGRALRDQAARVQGLSECEQRRLTAHAEWLLTEPQAFDGIKKRVEGLPPERRSEFARFVAHVAVTDGTVDPTEVKALQRLFKLLGLDPDTVHEELHAVQGFRTQRSEPVSVLVPTSTTQGFAIPVQPTQQRARTPRRELDMAAVHAKIAESSQVANMLATIFVEDVPPTSTEIQVPNAQHIAGLDPKYFSFFRRLDGRASWSRADFNALATECGVLPDGAIDAINEASLDACSATVIEGDDPITVELTVYEELARQ